MRTRTLLIALAGTGLVATGPSLAEGASGSRDGAARVSGTLLAQGGGFDALRARTKGTVSRSSRRERSRGDENASDRAVDRADENSAVTGTESESATPEPRASDRAVERANENSAVGGPEEGAASTGDLAGLEVGLAVRGPDGAEIGRVERVNRSSDGTVRNVIISRANGQGNMTLAPGSLSVSGGVVTTTSPQ
jgi:hypothetical protein